MHPKFSLSPSDPLYPWSPSQQNLFCGFPSYLEENANFQLARLAWSGSSNKPSLLPRASTVQLFLGEKLCSHLLREVFLTTNMNWLPLLSVTSLFSQCSIKNQELPCNFLCLYTISLYSPLGDNQVKAMCAVSPHAFVYHRTQQRAWQTVSTFPVGNPPSHQIRLHNVSFALKELESAYSLI